MDNTNISTSSLSAFQKYDSRINALDAERLHDELLYMLESQITSCWSLSSQNCISKLDLTFLLRLIIYFASTYRYQPSPSDATMNVKLSSHVSDETFSHTGSGPILLSSLVLQKSHQNFTVRQKWGFLFFIIIGPWILTRLREHLERSYRDYNARRQQIEMRRALQSEPDRLQTDGEPIEEAMPQLAKLHRPVASAAAVYDFASLINFLVFIVQGKYRLLEERLLGLEIVPIMETAKRELNFAYLEHHLYWHTITEFLLAVVPTLDIEGFVGLTKGVIRCIVNRLKKHWKQLNRENYLKIETFNRKRDSNLQVSWKKRCTYTVLRLFETLKRARRVYQPKFGIDPTALNLSVEEESSPDSSILIPGSLLAVWHERRSIKELFIRLGFGDSISNCYHQEDFEVDLGQGKQLIEWIKNPFSTPCGFCNIHPITCPYIGDCYCLVPCCYLCISLKQLKSGSFSSFICSYCGTVVTQIYQLTSDEIFKIQQHKQLLE